MIKKESMSSDDLTKELRDGEGKPTQPMIADLFRLIEEMKQRMETRFDETNARIDETNARIDATNARIDATNTRLDGLESRLADVEARLSARIEILSDRIEILSDRMEKGFIEVGDKIDALNRGRLQTEAEHSNILRRIRDLESKAS
jgi:chromosome segregation ATPase